MLTNAGEILTEYDDELSRVYGHYSNAVGRLPGLLQRIVNGVASRVFADHHLQQRRRHFAHQQGQEGTGVGTGRGGQFTSLKVVNEVGCFTTPKVVKDGCFTSLKVVNEVGV